MQKNANPIDSIFLTVTFAPTYLNNKKTFDFVTQFYKTISNLYNRLNKVSDDFKIYPEMTKVGVLHYHCIFTPIHAKADLYMKLALFPRMRREGFISAESIRDMSQTYEYCKKDWLIAKDVLKIESNEVGITKKYNIRAWCHRYRNNLKAKEQNKNNRFWQQQPVKEDTYKELIKDRTEKNLFEEIIEEEDVILMPKSKNVDYGEISTTLSFDL